MTQERSDIRQWTRAIHQSRIRSIQAVRQTDLAALERLVADSLDLAVALVRRVACLEADLERMHARLIDTDREWESLLDAIPIGCIVTDDDGFIVAANAVAAALLCVSGRSLAARHLILFCEERDRAVGLLRARRVGAVTDRLRVRPREHAPIEVDVTVLPDHRANTRQLFWFFRRLEPDKHTQS